MNYYTRHKVQCLWVGAEIKSDIDIVRIRDPMEAGTRLISG